MARPLRIEFPGAVYHVTSRGDRREPIFEYLGSDSNYEYLGSDSNYIEKSHKQRCRVARFGGLIGKRQRFDSILKYLHGLCAALRNIRAIVGQPSGGSDDR